MKTKADWKQDGIIHCPDYEKCDGLLLQSQFFHEMKCSKCGKYWLEVSHFVQTNKPENEEDEYIIFSLHDSNKNKTTKWKVKMTEEYFHSKFLTDELQNEIYLLEEKVGVLDFVGDQLIDGVWQLGYESYEVTNWQLVALFFMRKFKKHGIVIGNESVIFE